MSSITAASPLTAVAFTRSDIEKPHHDHCPLCVDEMVHPKGDERDPVVIFLDMDGVMIGDRARGKLSEQICDTLKELYPNKEIREMNDYQWTVAKGRHLHQRALKNLDALIDRIEAAGKRALVVLSSAWRNDATLQQLREEAFTGQNFCKYLCGKAAPEIRSISYTPECKERFEFSKGALDSYGIELNSRPNTIKFWLLDHGFDPEANNYIAIDDMYLAGLGDRFIQTCTLFEEKHLEKALAFLKV